LTHPTWSKLLFSTTHFAKYKNNNMYFTVLAATNCFMDSHYRFISGLSVKA
jgi:hypothetical protein